MVRVRGKGKSLYELLSVRNSHLALTKCKRGSSSDDDGESNQVSGAYKVPKICGSLIIGQSFALRSWPFVDEEICIVEYNNLCNIRYDRTQIYRQY